MAVINRVIYNTFSFGTSGTSVSVSLGVTIDPTKSIILITHSGGWERAYRVIPTFNVSNDAVDFVRTGTDGNNITGTFYVIEWSSGVTVQRGASSGVTTPHKDITISTVDPAKSFCFVHHTNDSGGSFTISNWIASQITSSTNLRVYSQETDNTSYTINYQVVEYDGCEVSNFNGSLDTLTQVDTTIASHDPTLTWPILMVTRSQNTAWYRSHFPYARLTTSTNLRVACYGSANKYAYYVQLVKFTDGTELRNVFATFGTRASAQTQNYTITSVDTNRSLPISAHTYDNAAHDEQSDSDNGTTRNHSRMSLTSSTNVLVTYEYHSNTNAGTLALNVIQFNNSGAPSGTTGTISATAPTVTSDLNGTTVSTGTISATAPEPISNLIGAGLTTGSISATAPAPTSTISGTPVSIGTISATIPAPTSDLTGMFGTEGTIEATIPAPTSNLIGRQITQGTGLLGTITNIAYTGVVASARSFREAPPPVGGGNCYIFDVRVLNSAINTDTGSGVVEDTGTPAYIYNDMKTQQGAATLPYG